MSNQESKMAPATPAPAPPRKSSRVVSRTLMTVIVGGLTVAALVIGTRWCCYRYRHVVLGEAVVKGTVTKLGVRLEGRIKSIEVEVGQRVAKGQVLLRMEDRHLIAALDRARAELQSATNDLTSEKQAIEQSRRRLTWEIDRANGVRLKVAGEVEAARSSLVSLQKQYDRIATLFKSGAAASSEVDRITGDRDRAQGNLNAATGAAETAESSYQKAMNELEGLSVRETHLAVLNSQIAAVRARVAVAEADVDAAVICAPEGGLVLERTVELGGSAKVGEPMIALWIGRPWLEAWADERDLRKIHIGSPVDISLDADPTHKMVGRVEAIGLASDKQLQPAPVPSTLRSFVRQNAMVPIRIALEDEKFQLGLGLSAIVGINKESEAPERGRSRVAQASPLGDANAHPRQEHKTTNQ